MNEKQLALIKEAFMAGAAFGRCNDSDTFWEEVEVEETAYGQWFATVQPERGGP